MDAKKEEEGVRRDKEGTRGERDRSQTSTEGS